MSDGVEHRSNFAGQRASVGFVMHLGGQQCSVKRFTLARDVKLAMEGRSDVESSYQPE